MYSETGTYAVEVCFSPLSWHLFRKSGALVVVTDIFRASTAICAAFHNGVKSIVPVTEISESERYKQKGFIVAGERDGKKIDCADFGNSPFNFLEPSLRGQVIVMNTTNGTQAIKMAAADNNTTVIGAFINIGAVVRFAMELKKDLIIFCAGWKNKFSMEDSLFAGALVSNILESSRGTFHTTCDSAIACADLWEMASPDPLKYLEKAAHRHRLKKMGLDDILEFSLTRDITGCIPIFLGDRIIDYRKYETQS